MRCGTVDASLRCMLLAGSVAIALMRPSHYLAAEDRVPPPITALAFAPAGQQVCAGSQAGIEVRGWPDLDRVKTLETKLSHVHDLVFSPCGDLLAAAGGSPGEGGIVELFAWPEGRLLLRLTSHEDLVYAAAFSPDGQVLATASADRSVVLHNAATGAVLRRLEGHSRGVMAVCFLGDGSRLLTAGIDQSLRLWNAKTGEPVRSQEQHTRPVYALAARPGQPEGAPPMVASAGEDRTVRLWQPTIGRMVRFARLETVPLALAWTSDGALLAAACQDGHVRIFNPDALAVVQDTPAIDGWAYSLAAAPEGRAFLAGGQAGAIRRISVGR